MAQDLLASIALQFQRLGLRFCSKTTCSRSSPSGPVCWKEGSKGQLVVPVFGQPSRLPYAMPPASRIICSARKIKRTRDQFDSSHDNEKSIIPGYPRETSERHEIEPGPKQYPSAWDCGGSTGWSSVLGRTYLSPNLQSLPRNRQ